jgi:hypothetical protein
MTYPNYLVRDFILNHTNVEGLVKKEFGSDGMRALKELREV